MAVKPDWKQGMIHCSDVGDILVFNRTRPGSYKDELNNLPTDIKHAMENGELELWQSQSEASNKIVLRCRAHN